MATRFTAVSVGELGTSYTLVIDDSSGGSNTDVEINGFTLTYDPDEQEDPITPIISSSCTFTIKVDASNQSAINTLIDDMVTADEGRFRVKITKAGSVWWVGFVITDQISVEDQDWADVLSGFTVRAVDGISRLKDLDYNNAGTAYSGRVLAREHLFNILDKIGLDDFYGASDNFLFIICRWYEDSMGAAVTDNPLSKTYIDHQVFIETNEEGNDTFTSCYDVLKQLCQLFLARFYYSNGIYRYDQVGEYRETTVTRIKYYKDEVYNTSTTGEVLEVVESSDDILRLGNVGGRFFYFPPAREIRLTYEHINNRNYLSGANWTDNSDPAVNIPQVGRENIRFWVRGVLFHQADFTPDSDFEICFHIFKFTITTNVGGTTYYAKRDYSFNNAGVLTYTAFSWTTDSSDAVYLITELQFIDSVSETTDISFETAELPGSGEFASTSSFDVAHASVWKVNPNQGPSLVFPAVTWEFWNPVLQLNSDEDGALMETSVFKKTNADTPNASLVLEYETSIADSPSSGTLFMPNNLTIDNAGTEEISSLWAKGLSFVSAKKIQNLWLDEAMKIRTKSIERYEGQFRGTAYHPHNLIELIDGRKFVIQRATYNSKTEIWAGDWWFVAYDDTLTGSTGPIAHDPGELGPGPTPPGGPKVVSPKTPAPADPIASARPDGGQLGAITDTAISEGIPITTIGIEAIGSGCVIGAGDTITVYDPLTGDTYDFTVTSDVGSADTTITISSATPDVDLSSGSYVVLSTADFVGNIQDCVVSRWYDQSFDVDNATGVTVTANGGTMPTSNTQMWVFYNGQFLPNTGNWSKAGSVVSFTFRAFGNVYIRFTV